MSGVENIKNLLIFRQVDKTKICKFKIKLKITKVWSSFSVLYPPCLGGNVAISFHWTHDSVDSWTHDSVDETVWFDPSPKDEDEVRPH